MENKNILYLNTSKKIANYLHTIRLDNKIIDFNYENQFQYNLIAIYILGEKKSLEEVNNFIFNEISKILKETQLDINILYNYIENNNLYDAEFLQGIKEVKKGYSAGSFGKYSEISDLSKEFYSIHHS